MRSPKIRALILRGWRLALLCTAILLIREAQQRREDEELASALTAERVRDFFPSAASLDEPDARGRQAVRDAQNALLGHVATTLPESKSIIGYAGPTHSLLTFDPGGTLLGIRILKSHDTPDHLAEVVSDRKFFAQFRHQKPKELRNEVLHSVTGATLTSTAIVEGVLAKLGASAQISLRFPEEITLEEVRRLEPSAASLRKNPSQTGGMEVLDEKGQRIGIVTRSSPTTDNLIGYKGPTDTLMLLDARGERLRRVALRKSYDTARYVAYVTGDEYFQNLFNDRTLQSLADMDFQSEKIEGVSGATETSWAIAEGLKQTAEHLLNQQPTGWLRQVRWRWQDTGHIIMLLSAFAMAFTRLRGVTWLRHTHHTLLVVYGGFIAGELLSQGLLTGWAAHGTPWKSAPGLLMLAAVALLGPVFTSKHLYCHHLCAHGALQQLLARRIRLEAHVPQRFERLLTKLPFALLALIFISIMLGWGLDLNALEAFDAYLIQIAGWSSIVIAIIGLLASLHTPLAYCKYGCPTGALFKLLRHSGPTDRIGPRDWLAALALTLGAAVLALA